MGSERHSMSNQAERFLKAVEPKSKSLAGLVRELFEILDCVETTDSGREFKPTTINSCRILHTEKLRKLLPKMKELAFKRKRK